MEPTQITLRKFAGLRSNIASERMEQGDLTSALNIRLDESGQIIRRAGYVKSSDGATYGLFSDGNTTLCVRSRMLCIVNPDNSLTPITPAGNMPAYCAVNGVIYWTDGERTGIVEAGRARSWGIAAPPLMSVTRGAGSLAAGIYQYAWVFVRADGQESCASEVGMIELPDDSAIMASAPTSQDPDVIRAALFVSTCNGTTLYLADKTTLGGAVAVVNESGLSSPLMTQNLSSAPAGQTLAYFAGRVWMGSGDFMFPSSAHAHELFDLREYLPLDGRVAMMAPQSAGGGMFVGTSKGAFYLLGSDPLDMSVLQKTSDPVIPGCLAYVPGKLLGDGQFDGFELPVWAGVKGIYAGYPDGNVVTLTEQRIPMMLDGHGGMFFDRVLRQIVVSAQTVS